MQYIQYKYFQVSIEIVFKMRKAYLWEVSKLRWGDNFPTLLNYHSSILKLLVIHNHGELSLDKGRITTEAFQFIHDVVDYLVISQHKL